MFGPFVSLLPIVGMLLGVALSEHAPTAGIVVFDVFAVATLLVGVRLAAGWLAVGLPLATVHPGYLVPTVAGGMLAAGGLARTGQVGAARAAFAIGLLCWLVIGSILLARLLRRPPLPAALVPTLAIGVTPPVLAGNAYLAITGGRVDALGYVLAGYAVLMVAVQVRLVTRYRRLAFTHGIWAFAFSYAATAVFALHWIELARPLGGDLLAALVLVAITALIGGDRRAHRGGTVPGHVPAEVRGGMIAGPARTPARSGGFRSRATITCHGDRAWCQGSSTAEMRYFRTEASRIWACCSPLGPAPRNRSTSSSDAHRSYTRTRSGSIGSAVTAKSWHPGAARACSTTVTHSATYRSRSAASTRSQPETMIITVLFPCGGCHAARWTR